MFHKTLFLNSFVFDPYDFNHSATLLICRNTNKETSIILRRFIMIIKTVRTIPFLFSFIVIKKFQKGYSKISMSGNYQKI